MNSDQKILFISFQGINRGRPNGMVKFLLPILEEASFFYGNKYLLSKVDGYNGTFSIIQVSFLYRLVIKLIGLSSRFIFHFPSHVLRYLHEQLFDYFVSLKIRKPLVIISTAYLHKSTKKNRNLGGVNVFLAGNPDDFEIHQLLKSEKERHNVCFEDAYTYEKRINFLTKSLLAFDQIITFTMAEYESYLKRIPKVKVSFIEHHILPSPIVFPSLSFSQSCIITFCFVAHPFWLKGLPYLLEAWSQIEAKNIKLRIAGVIDKQLQSIIDIRYSKIENIEYHGWVLDLNTFYRTSDICIVPSLLDAGPTTVAEAMYCGLPVIVSDGCGARTLIKNGENGFIVTSGNAEAIAKSIKWFINNPKVIPLMRQKAKETIMKLEKSDQNKKVAEHILNVIESLQRNENTIGG